MAKKVKKVIEAPQGLLVFEDREGPQVLLYRYDK